MPALIVSSLNSLAWQVRSLRSDPNSPASLWSYSQAASAPARKMLTVPCTCPVVSHHCLSAVHQPEMLFSPNTTPIPPSKTNHKWHLFQSLPAPPKQSPASFSATVTSVVHLRCTLNCNYLLLCPSCTKQSSLRAECCSLSTFVPRLPTPTVDCQLTCE